MRPGCATQRAGSIDVMTMAAASSGHLRRTPSRNCSDQRRSPPTTSVLVSQMGPPPRPSATIIVAGRVWACRTITSTGPLGGRRPGLPTAPRRRRRSEASSTPGSTSKFEDVKWRSAPSLAAIMLHLSSWRPQRARVAWATTTRCSRNWALCSLPVSAHQDGEEFLALAASGRHPHGHRELPDVGRPARPVRACPWALQWLCRAVRSLKAQIGEVYR